MSYSLSPNVKARFFITGTNRPLAGGLLYTYLVGTTTPAATYSDNLGTPNTNPIVLDADGECDLYLDDDISYRMILKNSAGVTQFDGDRIRSISSAQLASLASTVAATAADRVQTGLDVIATEAARDAALIQAGVYTTEALGRAAVADGEAFKVQGTGNVAAYEYRRTNSTTSVLIATYSSSSAVEKPIQTGKYNGWPDPFFRKFDLTNQTFLGRDRWWWNGGGAGAFAGWSLVNNPIFDGKALRKADGYNGTSYSGLSVWLDEIGAVVGDYITVYVLIVGTSNPVYSAWRFTDSTEATIQTTGLMLNDVGVDNITPSATPKWLRASVQVPSGAARFNFYPYNLSGSVGFDVVAVWAHKGLSTDVPTWPTQQDELYYRLRDADLTIQTTINTQQTAELDYMMVATGTVTAASTATNLAVTGAALNSDVSNPFTGWGERYTPASISFNAVKVKYIGRHVANTTAKWRNINVVVRTGTNSHLTGATAIAVGSVTVNPDSATLSDLTILLKDPTTGVVKTLTNADFSGSEYFIGVYATTADGSTAGMSYHTATQSNTIGQSYYLTSQNPLTATWATDSSNHRVGVDHLLLTTPVEGLNYALADGLKNQIDDLLLLPIKSVNTQQTAELDYMMVSTGVVTSASSTTNLAVTGAAIDTTYSNVFTGWGERYTPASISFNAVTIKKLGRNIANTTVKWRTLNIVVRTGTNSHLTGATVVAVGSITVNPNADTLTNITILLKDPTTGAVKTLTNADFANNEYFIGVYARDAANAGAGMSFHAATQSNTLSQSYYLTSENPLTATWGTNSGNQRVGVDHLLLTTPVEGFNYEPSVELIAQLNAVVTPAVLPTVLVVPPAIYGVQGRECNIYFDNLYIDDSSLYLQDVTNTAANGAQQRERWTWIPTGAQTTGTLSISACDKKTGAVLVSATTNQRAAASTAGSGTTKIINTIGDSLINGDTITQTVIDIAASDVMGVTMIGTRGTGANKHEGRGGWTINDFSTVGRTFYSFTVSGVVTSPAINSTEYTNNGSTFRVQELALVAGSGTIICERTVGTNAPSASGTLTKSSGTGDATIAFSASSSVSGNPFWISGALNYPQYLVNNSLATPDWVVIHLGINDSFGYTSDVAVVDAATVAFVKLDSLITSIKAAGAGVKVALMIPTPPANQDAFAANYGTGQTSWRYKRNIVLWAKEMITKYAGQEASRIYLVPTNTALDIVNGYPLSTSAPVNSRSSVMVQRQNNGVHPDTSGYQQIGDCLWAFLKCNA